MKQLAFIFFFYLSLFIFASKVAAQVLINEFSSSTSDDWIELYSYENVDISGWLLKDSTGTMKTISQGVNIGPSSSSFLLIDVNNRLNNSGDEISLIAADGTSLKDKIVYGGEGNVCLPDASGSIGRYPDGGNTIDRFLAATKGASNNSATLNPCVAPTQTPTATTAPTQVISTPAGVSKGIFKINDAKNSSGTVLSQAKIYIDGVYVHHYAPEIFEFCSGCKCDTVACGFGNHEFRIEKEGFNNWNEVKTINAGDNFEVNPVMQITSPTAVATLKPTIKPTLYPTLSISNITTAAEGQTAPTDSTVSSLVLGEIDQTDSGQNSSTSAVLGTNINNFPRASILFIVAGFLFIASAFGLLIKNKSSLYNKERSINSDDVKEIS